MPRLGDAGPPQPRREPTPPVGGPRPNAGPDVTVSSPEFPCPWPTPQPQLPRVIPCLLLSGQGLVKTARFRRPTYLGDPINIVRIFNEKEVDELLLLDIRATPEGRPPAFDLIRQVAEECFAPVGYGGGIRTLDDIRRVLAIGIEKVVLNTHAVANPSLVEEAAGRFGSQSVVVSLDAKKTWFGGQRIVTRGGRHLTAHSPVRLAREMEQRGAGEILLNSVDRDGTGKGYDTSLIGAVARAISIPLVACGGAGRTEDFAAAIEAGAHGVAAGSVFVFSGPNRAVLVTYPTACELRRVFRRQDRRS